MSDDFDEPDEELTDLFYNGPIFPKDDDARWLSVSPRLGPAARAAIDDPASDVHVSAVSASEIAIRKAIGKLTAPDDLEHQMSANGFTELGLSIRHGLAVGALPLHDGDPFDRTLIAQARVEGLTLVTADRIIVDCDVPILAADA